MTGASAHAMPLQVEFVETRPWTIMVADDSALWRAIISKAVRAYGGHLNIVETATGRQTLEALSEQRIDMAFVDLAMPEINGDEVVKHVRQFGKMPFFVVVSVTSDANEIARMRRLAAYDYLVKPFGEAAIAGVLRTYERVALSTRVLVVDDSGTARSIIARILQRSIFNFEIEQAGDGLSAFEVYARKPADVVFLDLNMPGIDGEQTLRILRAHNPHVRVVVMSGSQEALDRLQGQGAAAALKKPFFPADLDRVLHHLYGLKVPYEG